MTGFNKLTYADWIPREGMRGWFRELSKAWGNPNHYTGARTWPKATLEAVCYRGEPKHLAYDRHCNDSMVYFIANGRHRA